MRRPTGCKKPGRHCLNPLTDGLTVLPLDSEQRAYADVHSPAAAHINTGSQPPSSDSSPDWKRLHLFGRAWQVYGDVRYERLAGISVAHLYNLRATPRYQDVRVN